MRSKTVGRALGIGLRLAGKTLVEPNAASAQQPPADPRTHAVHAAGVRGRARGEELGRGTRRVGRGTRNFGRAVWNPFAQAAGVLWLEITGMFFALFALFFAQHLYGLRGAWRSGVEHQRFLLYAALLALFVYFSATSFFRAKRGKSVRDKAKHTGSA